MLIFSQVYYNSFFMLCKQFHKYFTKNFSEIVIFSQYSYIIEFCLDDCEIMEKIFLFHKVFLVDSFFSNLSKESVFFSDFENSLLTWRLLFLLKNALFKGPFINDFLLCRQLPLTFSLTIYKITFVFPAIF